MALPASSDFTGASENPISEGGNWNDDTSTFNRCQRDGSGNAQGTGGGSHCLWAADTFGDDHYSEVELSGSTWSFTGPSVRHNTSKNDKYIGVIHGTTTLRIYKVVASAYTQLATKTVTALSAGDKLKLEVTGSSLELFVDTGSGWVSELTATNSDVTGNGSGLHFNDSSSTVTAWGGGDLGGSSAIVSLVVQQHGSLSGGAL